MNQFLFLSTHMRRLLRMVYPPIWRKKLTSCAPSVAMAPYYARVVYSLMLLPSRQF